MALCLPPPPPPPIHMHHAGHADADPRTYAFVALPGNAIKKRPRRRYDEIERLYGCSFPDCNKAYGTLNHLNAHVAMQRHGPKRSPNEFKELRKQWRKAKKDAEAHVHIPPPGSHPPHISLPYNLQYSPGLYGPPPGPPLPSDYRPRALDPLYPPGPAPTAPRDGWRSAKSVSVSPATSAFPDAYAGPTYQPPPDYPPQNQGQSPLEYPAQSPYSPTGAHYSPASPDAYTAYQPQRPTHSISSASSSGSYTQPQHSVYSASQGASYWSAPLSRLPYPIQTHPQQQQQHSQTSYSGSPSPPASAYYTAHPSSAAYPHNAGDSPSPGTTHSPVYEYAATSATPGPTGASPPLEHTGHTAVSAAASYAQQQPTSFQSQSLPPDSTLFSSWRGAD